MSLRDGASSGGKTPSKRYIRHPYLTFALLFSLCFSGIMIFSLLPIPLFLSLNMNIGDVRLEDLPNGSIVPEIDPNRLLDFLQNFDDLLLDLLDNVDNFDDLLDLFDTEYFNATKGVPEHYWRQYIMDVYDGTNSWAISDSSLSYDTLATPTGTSYAQTLIFNKSNIDSADVIEQTVPLHDEPTGNLGIDDITISFSSGGYVNPAPDYTEILQEDGYGAITATAGPLTGHELLANYEIIFEDVDLPLSAQNSSASLIPSSIISQYTQTPTTPLIGWSYVQTYAAQLDADPASGTSVYEKSQFVIDNLTQSFSYDPFQYLGIDPSDPYSSTISVYEVPAGVDAVHDFMYNRGWGIFYDFVAAHAVLLRLMGIPTRYISGFSVGDRSGTYEVVKFMNAHAWTEVYLPINSSYGMWWPFDPSSSTGFTPPTSDNNTWGDLNGGDGDLDASPPGNPGGSGEYGGGAFGDGEGTVAGAGFGGGEGVWGFGDFGPSGTHFEAEPATSTNRSYWKMNSYDEFDSSTWTKSNVTYANVTNVTAAQVYNITIDLVAITNGTALYPLPVLSPIANMIDGSFNVTKMSGSGTINQSDLLYDVNYGAIYWNVSIGGSVSLTDPTWLQVTYSVPYNGSYDGDFDAWAGNMNAIGSPGSPNDGSGINYTSVSYIPQYIRDEIDQFRNHPALTTVNDTVLAVMEYFKTNFSFTPELNGTGYDLDALFQNGYGTSAQISTAFVMFLRDLGISSRLVYGGIQLDPSNYKWISNEHFWAEVWIEDDLGFGDWVQFDPVPLPKYMYNETQGSGGTWYPARIPDEKVRTMHYDVNVTFNSSSVVSRGTGIEFTASLWRDNQILKTNLLNQKINISFYDLVNDTFIIVDEPVNDSGYVQANTTFTTSDVVGPHPILGSFKAVMNATTIGLTGETNITLSNVVPDPLIRGENFTASGLFEDPVTHQALYPHGYYINISSPNQNCTFESGNQYTTPTGFQGNFSVSSTHPAGAYFNLTAAFYGTFSIEWPVPYNYILPNYLYISGTENVSGNYTINLWVGSTIENKTVYSDIPGFPIVAGHNTTVNGTLVEDDGVTPIVGEYVDLHWSNSSGDFNLSSVKTDANGNFSFVHEVPLNDVGNVDVYVVYRGNSSRGSCVSAHDPAVAHLVEIHILSVTPSVATIGTTSITISGNVTLLNATLHPQGGFADFNYEVIFNDTVISSTQNTTNANGEFTHTFIVPRSDIDIADMYNVSIFNSTSDQPIQVVRWYNKTIELNYTTSIANTLVNGTTSKMYCQLNETLEITGSLLDNTGHASSNMIVNASILGQELGGGTTDANGDFTITFDMPENATLLGDQQILLTFYGTNYYNYSSTTVDIYVFNGTVLNINASRSTLDWNEQVTLSGSLLDSGGVGLVGRTVQIYLNSTLNRTVITQVNGFYQTTYTPYTDFDPPTSDKLGYFNATARFMGAFSNTSYNVTEFNVTTSSKFFTLLVNGSTNFYAQMGEPVVVTGYLKNTAGTAPFSNQNISIHLNGITLGAAFTDANGLFQITTTVTPLFSLGTNTITVLFNGTTSIASTSDIITFFVFDNNVNNLTISLSIGGSTRYNAQYRENGITIQGNVLSGSDPIYARYVDIYITNVTFGNGSEFLLDSLLTDVSGTYSKSFTGVELTNYLGQFNVTAVLRAGVAKNSSHAYNFNLQVNATTTFNNLLVNSSSYLNVQQGENVNITGYLSILGGDSLYYNSSGYNISAHVGGITIGSALTDGNGFFYIEANIPAGATIGPNNVNLKYNGTDFILATNQDASILVFDIANIGINVLINGQNPPYQASYKENIVISGSVVLSGIYNIQYRTVNLYIKNLTLGNNSESFAGSVQTNAQGAFTFPSNPAEMGEWQVIIELVALNSKNSTPASLEVNYTSTYTQLQIYNDDLSNYQSLVSQTYFFHVGWEYINITGRLTENGGYDHWNGKSMELLIDDNLTVTNVTYGGGYFQFTYRPTASNASLGTEFDAVIRFNDANPYINNITFSFKVYFYTTPQLSISSNNPSYYFTDVAVFSGQLVDAAAPAIGIPGKYLTIIANFSGVDTTIATPLTTGTNGAFSVTQVLSSQIPDWINVTVTYHGTSKEGGFVNLGVRPFDITPIVITLLLVLVVAVVAAVGAFIALKLYRRQQEIKAKIIDVVGNAQKIQTLLDGGRINEAIIFLFSNLAYISRGYLKLTRKTGKTNREFIEMITRRVEKIDDKDAFLLLDLYEEARFSKHGMTRADYEKAEKVYNRLAKTIVNLTHKDVLKEKEEESIASPVAQEQVAGEEIMISE
ncbi:MAG: transglutaminase domain-containing protein [Candidatus Helarchaeota archaeon]